MTHTGRWVIVALLVGGGLTAGTWMPAEGSHLNGSWSNRFSPTSRGTLLLATTGVADVSFFDPSVDPNAVRLVQQGNVLVPSLANLEPGSGFALGSGGAASQVIGAWRRGTDFAWVWQQTIGSASLGTPVLVTATARQTPDAPAFNPEFIAIADGCVFMQLQWAINATLVKDVHRVDPVTGVATLVSGGIPVTTPGGGTNVGVQGIATSGCQAAFVYDLDNLATDANKDLYFYNGSTTIQIDTGVTNSTAVSLARGRIVYVKNVGGIDQVFLYDSTVASPAPVQLTFDAAGTNASPRTDGRHVAWIHVDGTTRDVMLNGGLVLTTDPATRTAAIATNPPDLQLDRGQLLWKGANGALFYHDGQGIKAIDIRPEATFDRQYVADGFIAYHTPTTNFLVQVTPPGAPAEPAPPFRVTATAGDGQATLDWDRVLGASSYVLYVAFDTDLTAFNWESRHGGRRLAVAGPPFILTGLQNGRTYQFRVAAVAGGVEGGASGLVSTTLLTGVGWQPGTNTGGLPFKAVAGDRLDPRVGYAGTATGVYQTTDGGATWTALGGGIAGRDVRALAARGGTVFAVTANADILRSTDGGGSWVLVLDGTPSRGPFMSVAIDPSNPNTIYAGSIEDGGFPGDTWVVKSSNGGLTWSNTPSAPSGPPLADLIPYAMAIDPSTTSRLYIGGSGEPVARSMDGGATWATMDLPLPNYPYSLALDPASPTTIYVGTRELEQNGIYKSYGDQHWTKMNTGLPGTLPQIDALLVDRTARGLVQAGTTAGYFYSTNGGVTWTALNTGLPGGTEVNALAMTGAGHVLAGTSQGVFRLDLGLPAGVSGIVTGADAGAGSHVRGFTGTGVPTALSFLVYPVGFTGGVRVATGDVDGDGARELITAAGPTGGPHIRVFSGPTASTVLTEFMAYDLGFTRGLFVAAGDVNGDGRADIVTGVAPGGGPHVKVFSLVGGVPTEIRSFMAYDPVFAGGITVAVCDVNRDGFADIVTGAGPGGGPHVQVFSGADGSVLRSFMAYDLGLRSGIFVACGDVDGDGYGDIITGVGPGGGPHVQVISGRTGAVLASFFAYDAGATVGMRVAAADLDGDGTAEIVTGPGAGAGAHVKAFKRAADGTVTEIASFFAYDGAFLGGVFVGGGR